MTPLIVICSVRWGSTVTNVSSIRTRQLPASRSGRADADTRTSAHREISRTHHHAVVKARRAPHAVGSLDHARESHIGRHPVTRTAADNARTTGGTRRTVTPALRVVWNWSRMFMTYGITELLKGGP